MEILIEQSGRFIGLITDMINQVCIMLGISAEMLVEQYPTIRLQYYLGSKVAVIFEITLMLSLLVMIVTLFAMWVEDYEWEDTKRVFTITIIVATVSLLIMTILGFFTIEYDMIMKAINTLNN